MNDALWLLMKMRFVAWFRRFGKQASNIKGALMTAFFALMMCFWLFGVIANRLFTHKPASTADPVVVQRFGGPGMLAFCVLIVLTAGTKPPILFSPAEIQFLFCGPFTRRQLLTYKLLTQLLMTLPFSVLMSVVFRDVAGSYAAAAIGALLIFTFLQWFGLAVNFAASYFSALAYNRLRKIILFSILAIAAVGGAVLVQRYATGGDIIETLKNIERQPVVHLLLTPTRWYSQVVTARNFSEFWLPALGATTINILLLVLIYVLDAKFLETVSTASEKTYAKIERMRRGGMPFHHAAASRTIRRQVPSFPHWGGVGPIAWRQFVTALRSQKAFLFMIGILFISMIGPIIAMVSQKRMGAGVPWGLAGMALFMSMFVNQFLAFDFRGDVDRIEVLKQLPLPAWRIALGQLLTPVLLTSLVQVTLVTVLFAVMGAIGPLVAVVLVFSIPFNMLLVGIDNAIFLFFPTRITPATPGDFSHAGRKMIEFFLRGFAMLAALAVPSLAAGVAYAVTENVIVTVLAGWASLVLICWLPVPVVAFAFKRFDVARDTPP